MFDYHTKIFYIYIFKLFNFYIKELKQAKRI